MKCSRYVKDVEQQENDIRGNYSICTFSPRSLYTTCNRAFIVNIMKVWDVCSHILLTVDFGTPGISKAYYISVVSAHY